MDKIFHVYASQGPHNYVEMDLPANDNEMLDLMERLRLEPGQLPYVEILKFREGYDYLEKCIHELPDIYQLNALAKKLAEFTSVQDMASFEGLVGKEIEKGAAPVEMTRLIDFAHSEDCCHVVGDAATDYELGRFLAGNGFVPEAEDLSEAAFELLDFSKIGREHRESEGGVFTGFGYVEQLDEVHLVSREMDFQPIEPAYTIMLKMSKGFFNDPAYDSSKTIEVGLPVAPEKLDTTLNALDAWDWREVGWNCLDCRIPSLVDAITDEDDIHAVNHLAQQLSDMKPIQLTAYKALLAAMDCKDIGQAVTLAGTVDEYVFSPKTSCPEDVAMSELRVMVGNDEADAFAKYVNLQAFGLSLLERDHAVITGYGLIERQDGQPIQTMEQKTEGMVMT